MKTTYQEILSLQASSRSALAVLSLRQPAGSELRNLRTASRMIEFFFDFSSTAIVFLLFGFCILVFVVTFTPGEVLMSFDNCWWWHESRLGRDFRR